jgi:AcrR family transcriptional regulator
MVAVPPRQRRKDARPGELMSAALNVFAERGFAATRLEEVARRAGVSKGTIYLYFESKEALFKASVEAAITPALEAAEALAADTATPPTEALRCFVFGWWQMVGATELGALPKLLVAESGNFPELGAWFHDNMIRRALRAAASIIDLGIRRGDFRPMEPLLAARIIFAPMFSYVIWRQAFSTCMADLPDPETYFSLAVDMLVHGLTAPMEPVR